MSVATIFYNFYADRTKATVSSLFLSSGYTHWSRKIVRSCRITVTLRKTEPSILVYYSILSSSWITRESKLCYFPKISANILEHKQFKDNIHRYWCLSKSVKKELDEQTVVFILLRIKVKMRRNVAKFYNVSFTRSLVLSQNSWPCCCNRLLTLIKTAAAKLIASSLYVYRLWAPKNIQESAASKTTQ